MLPDGSTRTKFTVIMLFVQGPSEAESEDSIVSPADEQLLLESEECNQRHYQASVSVNSSALTIIGHEASTS